MNEPKAKYQIAETFKITGRGIVFSGKILEGIVNLRDLIEFEFKGELLRRKVIGIDGLRSTAEKPNTGILIECKNDIEIEELRNWSPEGVIAKIYDGANSFD